MWLFWYQPTTNQFPISIYWEFLMLSLPFFFTNIEHWTVMRSIRVGWRFFIKISCYIICTIVFPFIFQQFFLWKWKTIVQFSWNKCWNIFLGSLFKGISFCATTLQSPSFLSQKALTWKLLVYVVLLHKLMMVWMNMNCIVRLMG